MRRDSQFMVIGDHLIHAKPDRDSEVNSTVGAKRCVRARTDHVPAGEVDQIDAVENKPYGFERNIVGVAT